MNDSVRQTVECVVHGEEGPAYVRRHLNLVEPVGFVEAYDPAEPDAELFESWCAACDQELEREGEWNDRSEAFAAIRPVCRACYREMKALNRAGT
ncbi:MAG: hypothetical protein GWM92_20780 [Gemmatimonadetes bacterium]|nr:hypothetical protein [Gemmatimonadota bacterium]NIR81286.1 hypothetical protein [Gemmatimonadota bacterium]NIT90121.1 hypothetical protein [Gemmatimonadota bacterium]NIU33948.1 hypothetical protein [Gemmatimonadota bacterium]NIU38127.1 hypothetical protein [Gemmatimonadota bacterium]